MGPTRAAVSASEGEDPGCWLLPRAMPTLGQAREGAGTCQALSLLGTLSLLRHLGGTPQPNKGCGVSPGDHPWGPHEPGQQHGAPPRRSCASPVLRGLGGPLEGTGKVGLQSWAKARAGKALGVGPSLQGVAQPARPSSWPQVAWTLVLDGSRPGLRRPAPRLPPSFWN